MHKIKDLYANLPIEIVIDYHIQNDSYIKELESKIHDGHLAAIESLENRVIDIIQNEIEDFEDKENFESSYLKRMKMLVRTKKILAS